MKQFWRVGWYRFRTTFARRWGGLLAIVALLALVGGLALGSVAGARRTQSSFPAYLARQNARNLGVLTSIYDPQLGFHSSYDATTVAKIARLPHVRQVADFTIVNPNLIPIGPHQFHPAPGQAPPTIGGSLDGEYSTLDRVSLVSGRRANPRRVDEVVMSPRAARELGVHPGSVVPSAFYTNAQLQRSDCCSADGSGTLEPHVEVNLEVVGIVELHTEIIEDDVDALQDDWVLLSPALMHKLVSCCSYVTETAITTDGGDGDAATVQAEVARAVPSLRRIGAHGGGDPTSVEVAKAERAIEPESIALGAFGGIAAIAALLIAGQLISRQLRLAGDERAVLRALGAGPATTAGDGIFGVVGAVAAGALFAGVVAVALSPLTLLGPVRHVEQPGIAFDWTVLGIGTGGLALVLTGVAVVTAYRQAPHRLDRSSAHRPRRSPVARAANEAGLPTSAATGIRFALDPGVGASAVPVRSAIVGAVLAITVLTATVTFAASLRTLVSRP
ncbi:MAG TPA: hypothetical protein VEP49_22825, partial [Acidimicrobiia bacterium]|nr:hypothetical protein [Acidimicrobiia bacterium]